MDLPASSDSRRGPSRGRLICRSYGSAYWVVAPIGGWPPRRSAFVLRRGFDLGNCLAGELVGTFVEIVAGMTAHPMPVHIVALDRSIEALPQIGVLDRLPVAGLPAVAFPALNPVGDSLAQILAVGMEIDIARALERFESHDGGRQFHPVVGCVRLAALELAGVAAPLQNCAPAARPRIARAGAVGMNDHAFTLHVSQCRNPVRSRRPDEIAACGNIR